MLSERKLSFSLNLRPEWPFALKFALRAPVFIRGINLFFSNVASLILAGRRYVGVPTYSLSYN